MRKVEADMIRVVRVAINRADVAGRIWKSGNTEVAQVHHGLHHTPGYYREIEVRLHGHKIAVIEPDIMRMSLYDCGYRTATTKSRLNALLSAFARGSARISQRDWSWYVGEQDWEGQDEFAII
jgi:hypothetical protein